MKAIRVHRFGPPEVMELEDVPQPTPGPGEVLVRVHVASLGPWDTWVRGGKSVLDQPLPLTPGSDISGVAVALGGDVSSISLGQGVFGVTNPRFTGGYAEYAVAQAAMLAVKPVQLGHAVAAAVPVVGVTAWQLLFDHARVKPGQRVLIHGGAGAVGALAVQLALAEGAQVIATARTPDVAYLRGLGAQVIDTTTTAFETAVEPVDTVIDTVGGELQTRSFTVIRRGGALISSVSEPDAARAQVAGVRASFMLVAVNTAVLTTLASRLEAGTLQLRLGRSWPLTAAAAREAHELLEGARPRTPGKLLFTIVE